MYDFTELLNFEPAKVSGEILLDYARRCAAKKEQLIFVSGDHYATRKDGGRVQTYQIIIKNLATNSLVAAEFPTKPIKEEKELEAIVH